jgi:MOSC domain-containing protein YiiM
MTIASDAAIVSIFASVRRSEPLVTIEDAELVAGRGFAGDKRFSLATKSSNQLTLIEEEAIVAALKMAQLEAPLSIARRNVVTRGVALNHLVGKRFVVGTAVVEGIELCEPCGHLAKVVSSRFSKALVHRGGLRCAIVESGRARAGDAVRSLP